MFGADALIEGRFLIDGRIKDGFLEVSEGRIVRLHNSHSDRPTHRFTGGITLPAALDIHVHMRDPDPNPAEDILHGTKAAALGGVTTVMDMPNNSPPITTEAGLLEKIRNHTRKACVDFGIYTGIPAGGFSEESVSRIGRISPLFKAYLGSTTGDLLVGAGDIGSLLLSYREGPGLPTPLISIHAEDEGALMDAKNAAAAAAGGGDVEIRDLSGHESLRPISCEISALEKLKTHLHTLQSKPRAPPLPPSHPPHSI